MIKNQPVLIDIGQGLSLAIGLSAISNWTTAERPNTPKRGTFGFNSDTNSLEYSDGVNWYEARMDA